MNYMSLCSGVEAISVAWKGLGFNPVAFSEIENFPSAVLKHHYPNVPNYGDMLNYKEWENDGTVGLIVGGTPCQSFSIAGLRKGLEDPRGNLMLTFGAIIKKYRPTWVLWENVPGVLSSNKGRDFGTFLAMLGQFGYGYAYRVLDAQHFGVAQRRRRVFVVGYLGDWRNPAKVLFEQESVRGNIKPSKEEKQGTAENSYNGSGASSEELEIPKLAPTLTNSAAGLSRPGNASNEDSWYIPTVAGSLDTKSVGLIRHEDMQQIVRLRKHKVNIDGLQKCLRESKKAVNKSNKVISKELNQPITLVEHWFRTDKSFSIPSEDIWNELKECLSIKTTSFDKQIMEFEEREGTFESAKRVYSIKGKSPALTSAQTVKISENNMAVRRLTPIEAERLQGFEDDYTKIPYRGKPKEQCPDGPRYKAMGNSMAVPVVRWIGQRIKMVNDDVC